MGVQESEDELGTSDTDPCEVTIQNGTSISLDEVFVPAKKHKASPRMSRGTQKKKNASSNQVENTKKTVKRTKSVDTFHKRLAKDKIEGHSFAWIGGEIKCQCCDSTLKLACQMRDPAMLNLHIEKLKTWKAHNLTQQSMETSITQEYKEDGANIRLSTEQVLAYRASAVEAVASANISFKAFSGMSKWIDQNSKDGLSLGCV